MTQEEKARAYDKAIERAKSLIGDTIIEESGQHIAEVIFPELKEPEDEKVRKALIEMVHDTTGDELWVDYNVHKEEALAWLEKQGEPQDKGEISDGYPTFNELYYYRMLYNAAFFNMLPKEWVHKSKKNHAGEECFGGGWFIVMANLPTGQISNHYELKDWDLFQIPEKEVADKWDGHTPQEAADRLHKYLLEKQGALNDKDLFYNGTSPIVDWLKALKDRVQLQNITVTDEELVQAKKDAYNDALDKIEYHSGEPTFDDGWSAAIWYLKKRNAQPQNRRKPSDEQIKVCKEVYADILLSAKGFDLGTVNSELNRLEEQLKKLREE